MSSIFTLSEHKRSTNKALAGKGKKTYNRGTEIRLPDKNFCRRKRRKKEEAYGTTGSGHAVKFFKSEAAGFLSYTVTSVIFLTKRMAARWLLA